MRQLNQQGHRTILDRIADRPRLAAGISVVLVTIFATLIRPPSIDGSMVDQMSGGGEQLAAARRIESAMGNTASAGVVLEPRDISIGLAFERIAAFYNAFAVLGDDVHIDSIDAAGDQLQYYDLDESADLEELLAVLADSREAAPLISADGRRFLVALTFPAHLDQAVLDVLNTFSWDDIASRHDLLSGAQIENDMTAALTRDLRLLIPVIVFTMLLALFAAFRSWRALALPAFASVATTTVTFALFSVGGIAINLVTLLCLPIVLIVGLANCCHFLARAGAEAGPSRSADSSARATLLRVGPPFFISSTTTAIALASLGASEVSPIAHLGLLSAATLLLSFITILLAAPLSLRWYLSGLASPRPRTGLLAAISRTLARRRLSISAGLLALVLAGVAAVPTLNIASNPRALLPDNADFARAQRLFEREFYAFSPLRVLVAADLSRVPAVVALRQAGEVRKQLDELPGTRFAGLQAGVAPGQYVITALLGEAGGMERAARLLALQRTALTPGMELVFSSAPMVYADIDQRAMASLLRSLGWSAALIFGVMLIVFRSPRAVFAALLANAVPLFGVCAVVWLIGTPLNLVTVFVFLVALGVIVDDAIHILFAHSSGDRLAGSSLEFSVLLSTAMLCLGLLLCQVSDFPTTREFAAYCALALITAVLSNLTLLPLLWRDRANPGT